MAVANTHGDFYRGARYSHTSPQVLRIVDFPLVFGNLLEARVWWCRDGNGEGSPPFSEAFSEGSNKKPSTGASGLNRGLGICQAYPH